MVNLVVCSTSGLATKHSDDSNLSSIFNALGFDQEKDEPRCNAL
jgi:hypothetical protein